MAARLAGRGLSFDPRVCHHQMAYLAENIAARREGIARVTDAPNVNVKLSGFGIVDLNRPEESLRPFVEHCIERFGLELTMFGANPPSTGR